MATVIVQKDDAVLAKLVPAFPNTDPEVIKSALDWAKKKIEKGEERAKFESRLEKAKALPEGEDRVNRLNGGEIALAAFDLLTNEEKQEAQAEQAAEVRKEEPSPPAEPIKAHVEERAFDIKAKSDAELTKEADDLLLRNEHVKAIEIYDQLLARNPMNDHAWHYTGRALLGLGRLDEALEAVEHSLNLKPSDEAAKATKSDLTIRMLLWGESKKKAQDHCKQGEANLSLGSEWYTDALEEAEKALKELPTYIPAWLLKGQALEGLGRNREALEAYNEALKLDPSDKDAKSKKEAVEAAIAKPEALLAEAGEAFKKGDFGQSARFCGEVLGQAELTKSIAVTALVGKGDALRNLIGKEADALAAFENALNLDPDNDAAFGLMCNVLDQIKMFEKMLAVSEAKLKRKPDDLAAQAWKDKALKNIKPKVLVADGEFLGDTGGPRPPAEAVTKDLEAERKQLADFALELTTELLDRQMTTDGRKKPELKSIADALAGVKALGKELKKADADETLLAEIESEMNGIAEKFSIKKAQPALAAIPREESELEETLGLPANVLELGEEIERESAQDFDSLTRQAGVLLEAVTACINPNSAYEKHVRVPHLVELRDEIADKLAPKGSEDISDVDKRSKRLIEMAAELAPKMVAAFESHLSDAIHERKITGKDVSDVLAGLTPPMKSFAEMKKLFPIKKSNDFEKLWTRLNEIDVELIAREVASPAPKAAAPSEKPAAAQKLAELPHVPKAAPPPPQTKPVPQRTVTVDQPKPTQVAQNPAPPQVADVGLKKAPSPSPKTDVKQQNPAPTPTAAVTRKIKEPLKPAPVAQKPAPIANKLVQKTTVPATPKIEEKPVQTPKPQKPAAQKAQAPVAKPAAPAVKVEPPKPAALRKKTASELFADAERLFREKKFNDALASFSAAAKLARAEKAIGLQSRALAGQGASLVESGKPEDALPLFESALKLDPKSRVAWTWKIDALRLLEQHADALKACNANLKADPAHAGAMLRKGLILEDMNRPQKAAEWFDNALKADPNNQRALKGKERVSALLATAAPAQKAAAAPTVEVVPAAEREATEEELTAEAKRAIKETYDRAVANSGRRLLEAKILEAVYNCISEISYTEISQKTQRPVLSDPTHAEIRTHVGQLCKAVESIVADFAEAKPTANENKDATDVAVLEWVLLSKYVGARIGNKWPPTDKATIHGMVVAAMIDYGYTFKEGAQRNDASANALAPQAVKTDLLPQTKAQLAAEALLVAELKELEGSEPPASKVEPREKASLKIETPTQPGSPVIASEDLRTIVGKPALNVGKTVLDQLAKGPSPGIPGTRQVTAAQASPAQAAPILSGPSVEARIKNRKEEIAELYELLINTSKGSPGVDRIDGVYARITLRLADLEARASAALNPAEEAELRKDLGETYYMDGLCGEIDAAKRDLLQIMSLDEKVSVPLADGEKREKAVLIANAMDELRRLQALLDGADKNSDNVKFLMPNFTKLDDWIGEVKNSPSKPGTQGHRQMLDTLGSLLDQLTIDPDYAKAKEGLRMEREIASVMEQKSL